MVTPIGLHLESRFKNSSMCFIVQCHKYANITLRLVLRYQIRHRGAKPTPGEAQVIENKQGRLQKHIDKFQHQADTFILHQHGLDHPQISPLGAYDQFDNVDSFLGLEGEEVGPPLQRTTPRTSDGSGMDHINPEDLPILLPSTLGWKWCIDNGVKSLAVKEARLQIAQANESIHKIRLALGFKSAIFHTGQNCQ